MKINNINGVQRFVVVFVTFLGVINVFLMRNSLGLTMTKLLKPPKSLSFDFMETYQWSPKLESLIHASFYIGYILGHIPGAYLAEKFGGKIVLNVGLFLTAFFTIITPFVITTSGAYGLIAMRFLMGLGEAPAFPALGSLLSAWVPPKERGVSSAFVLGGVQMGSLLSSLLTGEILQDTQGYAIIFFILGTLGIAWNILFHFTVSDRPGNHSSISDEEKEYLQREIGDVSEKRQIPNIPYTSLLTSKPVWALIIAQLGHDWALFFMGSYIPKFYRNILQMGFKEAGRYMSLAYFIAWIFSIFCGYLGGYLIKRKKITVTTSRKLFTVLSTIIPGGFLVAAAYGTYVSDVICMTISITTMGAFYAGNRVNVLDICPNYTASLLGLVNGLGAIAGIIAIFSTGLLTTKDNKIGEWRTIFWISLVVLIATTAVYVFWASGEIQSWNDDNKEDNWLRRLMKRVKRQKTKRAKSQIQEGKEQTPEPKEESPEPIEENSKYCILQ